MRPHSNLPRPLDHVASPRDRDTAPLPHGANDVALWRANLDQPLDRVRAMEQLLSPDEVARAGRFHLVRDRHRYIVGRGILRRLLGRCLDRAPREIRFHYGEYGKPAIAAPAGEPSAGAPIHFNVAHSRGVALYAVTRVGAVGIDLEALRELPDWERMAEATFSAGELARLRACPPARQRDEFFHCWTRHEAMLKALGLGLGGVAVPAGLTTAPSHFGISAIDAGPGFAAALAVGAAGQIILPVIPWDGLDAARREPDPDSDSPRQPAFP